MCLSKTLIYGERKNLYAYCDIYLDRFLYLVVNNNSEQNRKFQFLEREESLKILESAYQDCEERRAEINEVKNILLNN